MFIRFLVILAGLLLACEGAASALEPIRSNASMNEMMNGVRSAQTLVPRRSAPVYEKKALNKPRPTSQTQSVKPKTLIAMPAPKRQLNTDGVNKATSRIAPAEPSWHGKPLVSPAAAKIGNGNRPPVKAKALYCVDCSSNKVMLAENTSLPLPIASISKLLTAMVVAEGMEMDRVLEVPADITQVERHVIGLKPGDLLTVRDLLHGMLIESGNDCAEVLARAYTNGREGFIAAMNKKAADLGASRTVFYTPSGLDMKMTLGRKNGNYLESRKANAASAEDVAAIARAAFKNPLISGISSTKTYTIRTRNSTPSEYALVSNDKLLARNLPLVGAKTGYTNMAGRCIVALFKDQKKEHVVVVLNSPQHFKAAEKIYRWASKPL